MLTEVTKVTLTATCLSSLSLSPLQPLAFSLTRFRQQERACAVAFVLPLLLPGTSFPFGCRPLLPLLSLHGHSMLGLRLPDSESPSPALCFLHNTLLAPETPIHVSLLEDVVFYGIRGPLCLTHCLISSTWNRTWHSVHIGGSGYLLNGEC